MTDTTSRYDIHGFLPLVSTRICRYSKHISTSGAGSEKMANLGFPLLFGPREARSSSAPRVCCSVVQTRVAEGLAHGVAEEIADTPSHRKDVAFELDKQNPHGFCFRYSGSVPFLPSVEGCAGFQHALNSIDEGGEVVSPFSLKFVEEVKLLTQAEQRDNVFFCFFVITALYLFKSYFTVLILRMPMTLLSPRLASRGEHLWTYTCSRARRMRLPSRSVTRLGQWWRSTRRIFFVWRRGRIWRPS
ncbi:unnamed protein product [Cochlearia groenlandica]